MADLTSANLYYSNLRHAKFGGATLTGADFADAVLNGADFTGAIDAPATSAVASWGSSDEGSATTLASAHDGTNNHGALLHGADFSGANLSGAIFNHENDALDATGGKKPPGPVRTFTSLAWHGGKIQAAWPSWLCNDWSRAESFI